MGSRERWREEGGERERERESTKCHTTHHSLQAMLDFLEVKGEAMEASPSLTICGSASASIFFNMSFNCFYKDKDKMHGQLDHCYKNLTKCQSSIYTCMDFPRMKK